VTVDFGGNARGLDRADALEDFHGFRSMSAASPVWPAGQGAAAKVGQCVGLGRWAGDGAGLFQGLLVALLSLREVAAGPVQRPFLVECEFPVGPHVRSRPRPAGTVGPATAGPGQAAQTGRTRSDPSSRRGQPPSLQGPFDEALRALDDRTRE
jgi:hypothetical protein